MGKVGSTSVYDSLLENASQPVFQIHRFRLVPGTYVSRGAIRTALRKIWARFLLFLIKRKDLRILSMTRDPVKRNVSDFFQTLDHFMSVNGIDRNDVKASDLKSVFLGQYPHFSCIYWFDEQIKKVFGIDVIRNDSEVYRAGKISLMIVRMEDLNQSQEKISSFFGIPNIQVRGSNVGGNKWYSSLYSDFKKEILKEEAYQAMLEDTEYCRRFYPKGGAS